MDTNNLPETNKLPDEMPTDEITDEADETTEIASPYVALTEFIESLSSQEFLAIGLLLRSLE